MRQSFVIPSLYNKYAVTLYHDYISHAALVTFILAFDCLETSVTLDEYGFVHHNTNLIEITKKM
jgi:hypothetical protein